MSWAKLDDRFHENRKVRGLWRRSPSALGLHVLALTYCAGHETDGLVDREFVEDKVPAVATRRKLTDALVEARLWIVEGDSWRIHDFLDFHSSRAELVAKRAKEAERKARGRETQAAGRADAGDPGSDSPHRVRDVSARTDDGLQAESGGPVPSLPVPTPTTSLEVRRMCRLLADLILERDPKAKVAPTSPAWTTAMDRLVRLDGRSPDEVERIIRWAQADGFWQSNILSPAKLREKFTALVARAGTATVTPDIGVFL